VVGGVGVWGGGVVEGGGGGGGRVSRGDESEKKNRRVSTYAEVIKRKERESLGATVNRGARGKKGSPRDQTGRRQERRTGVALTQAADGREKRPAEKGRILAEPMERPMGFAKRWKKRGTTATAAH